jgi:hypothetical protein
MHPSRNQIFSQQLISLQIVSREVINHVLRSRQIILFSRLAFMGREDAHAREAVALAAAREHCRRLLLAERQWLISSSRGSQMASKAHGRGMSICAMAAI